ncbi:MAG TPA: acyl-CoA carboxylase subunit beta [Firmicutes bacterium]|jgi:acetyl-CoA carboxylase carboxyltransferase component|nr:acyl-CoA carboxylase subunit beta [Bacillota bacterium]
MEQQIQRLREVRRAASLGGGKKKIAREHEKGKLTARERIALLLDPDSFQEFNMLIKHNVGAPGDGIVIGHGTIDGRTVCIFAHDATVFGGSQGYYHGRKVYKIHEMALEMGVPLIGLNDSPGARVIRPELAGSDDPYRISDEKSAGVVFYINTRCSGAVPQISAILGNCTGGSVYSPALTDFIFMVDNLSRMFITGPRVIKSVLGEEISMEKLGGARVHCQVSGVADFRVGSEADCMRGIRRLLSYLPQNWREKPPFKEMGDPDDRFSEKLERIVPLQPTKGYDMHLVIEDIVDGGEFLEVKPEFAAEIIIGFARLGGYSVGIVANQPRVRAGCMSMDSSDKQARFIRFCDAFNIPLLLLVDTPGYLPGKEQEYAGIIRHGAKVLYALSEATVPKIALLLRKVYGGAALGMGVLPGFGTDLIFAWPTAEIGAMGAEQAVALFYADEIKNSADPQAFQARKVQEYKTLYADPMALASDVTYIHDIIEPRETRRTLIKSLRFVEGKKVGRDPKRHGNIPL